jgi:vacuolar-type H+-ATPase subunit I/STV1
MRVTVIGERNFQTLSRLLGDKIGASSVLDQLKDLNPQVDFNKKIQLGTVLLIPDAPIFRDVESASVSGDFFSALREQMLSSVTTAASRMRLSYEALRSEQAEVVAVLKLAAVKRAIEADPGLKQQIATAENVFKDDQQRAKDVEKTMQTLLVQVAAELDALAKLLA